MPIFFFIKDKSCDMRELRVNNFFLYIYNSVKLSKYALISLVGNLSDKKMLQLNKKKLHHPATINFYHYMLNSMLKYCFFHVRYLYRKRLKMILNELA